MYNTLIQPHLYYCIILLSSAYKTNLQHLQVLQKRAIRIFTSSKYLTHANPLFTKTNKLQVEDIYKLQVSLYMYKCKMNMIPYCLIPHESFLPQNLHNYNTRNTTKLSIPFCSTNMRKASIKISGPIIWNSVTELLDVKNVFSVRQLKLKRTCI